MTAHRLNMFMCFVHMPKKELKCKIFGKWIHFTGFHIFVRGMRHKEPSSKRLYCMRQIIKKAPMPQVKTATPEQYY